MKIVAIVWLVGVITTLLYLLIRHPQPRAFWLGCLSMAGLMAASALTGAAIGYLIWGWHF